MKEVKWIRVSKACRCGRCDSGDWCTLAPSIGLLCCMRVPSQRPCKNGGWLHPIDAATVIPPRKPERPVVTLNVKAVLAAWGRSTTPDMIRHLANQLGVSEQSLVDIGTCWSNENSAFAFPMYDGNGVPVGIRIRTMSGHKWSVKGSHNGLFMPCHLTKQ